MRTTSKININNIEGGIIVVDFIELPDKIKDSVVKMNKSKFQRVSDLFNEKIRDSYRYYIFKNYYNNVDYTSFDELLSSFRILENNQRNVKYFFDDEEFLYKKELLRVENNLFEDELSVAPQKDDIEIFDQIKANIKLDFYNYLSYDFWKDFDGR